MSYQAMWFRSAASQLRLLEPSLSLESVKEIVSDRLPLAVKEMELKGLDLDDPYSWWELLFVDGTIAIENAQGKVLRVAVYLTHNWWQAEKTLKVIESKKFRVIRADLGVDQHWIVFTDARKPYSNDEWMDVLYGQIDQEQSESGCALIEM